MKKIIITFVIMSAAMSAFAGIYYLKESRPLNGGTYECVYDVDGRELIQYQKWSCKPYIEM